MKKRTIIFIVLGIALVAVLIWFGKKNSDSPIEYTTETAFTTNIETKTVATGKVIPLEEVALKPKVSGIIDKIYVEEGAKVKVGDLIATIRVVPNEKSLNSARGALKSIKLRFENTKKLYLRNKGLFQKGVVSKQDFETIKLNYDSAKQDLLNAQNNLKIIEKGSANSSKSANTFVKSEISGTILEIPVRKGNQVIESNTFNSGTTIATVADMTKMIFEGKVDESEVGKIKNGTDLEISLGAIEGKKYPAKLNFIAPKGTEEGGAVQFKIKANVKLDDEFFVRAGYSANANIILQKKDSILAIKESLLQFDKDNEKPFVEVEVGDQKFEKREIKTGISDGINVEILSGITKEDKIKVWNKTKEDKEEKRKKRRRR